MDQTLNYISDEKEAFRLEDTLETLVFQEFFSVGENREWQIAESFDSIKYPGIEKFLKVMIGNVKSLYYLQESINKNILVAKEDKEIIENIMEILFEDKYYHSFLLEVFKRESEGVVQGTKEEYLQGLSKHLFEKEKELNILTFGVLIKSYEREKSKEKGSINFPKAFSLLGKLENRLEIEKEFLYKYKIIQKPKEEGLEVSIKSDLENICKALVEDKDFQEVETRVEELRQSIQGGNEKDRRKLASVIYKLGFMNSIVDELQKHGKILEKYTWLYKTINRIRKVYCSLDISLLLVDISVALASKQQEIKDSDSQLDDAIQKVEKEKIEKPVFKSEKKAEQERREKIESLRETYAQSKAALFSEISYLKSFYNKLEGTQEYMKDISQKVSRTFGAYILFVEKVLEDNSQEASNFSLRNIQKMFSQVSLLKGDVEGIAIHEDILNMQTGEKYKKNLERKELYQDILKNIDLGALFQVYIGILRYRLLYGNDKDLSFIMNYIDEQKLLSNYYEQFFQKLQKGQSIEGDIQAMNNFLVLIENESFGIKCMDIVRIKDDIEYLQKFFDSRKSISFQKDIDCISSNFHVKNDMNKYLELLMTEFLKSFDAHLMGAMRGDIESFHFLMGLKNIGFCKRNFSSFIDLLETINIECIEASILEKLKIFGQYYELGECCTYILGIIERYFLEKEIPTCLKVKIGADYSQLLHASQQDDYRTIQIISERLEKVKKQKLGKKVLSYSTRQLLYSI